MAGYILHGEEKNLVLRSGDVDALLQSGNADAALLYLAVMRASGGQERSALARSLQMSELRFAAAETALQDMGLLSGAGRKTPLPARERAEYTAEELPRLLADPAYAALRTQVEQKLGKRLTRSDDQILLWLYHDRGLPADVLYLLVHHCVERCRRRYGEGRRPTLYDIEKVGVQWADRGILDQESAARYLREYDRRLEASAPYMRALQLGDRKPIERELEYLKGWMDMGFPPETVAKAYEITVLRKQKLEWAYLGGILRRWHKQGWHTPEEVDRGEAEQRPSRRSPRAPASQPPKKRDNSWMKKYL